LAFLDVEFNCKPGQNNVILDVLSRKEELQVEKPPTKIQALKAIFQGENNVKWKRREAYVYDPFAQRYFKKWKKVKGITLKEGLPFNGGSLRFCLDCHTCNFFGLHTNVKFKTIFKINIVNFLIIHVVIDLMGIVKKFLDEFLKDYGFVMDFRNDNNMFVTQKK